MDAMKLSAVIAPAPVVRPRERRRALRRLGSAGPAFLIGGFSTAALVLLSAWARYLAPMVLQ